MSVIIDIIIIIIITIIITMLVSRCFGPSQLQRITSGLN